MKILHIINGLGVGGAEKTLLNFCRFSNNQNKIICLLPYDDLENSFRNEKVEIVYLNIIKIKNFINSIKQLKHQVKSFAPDKIICWMYLSCITSIFLFHFKNIVYWNIRHSNFNFFYTKITTYLSVILAGFI